MEMGENEDYMEGAEAGRRKRWRKKEEIIERKTPQLDSRKLMSLSYYMIIVLYPFPSSLGTQAPDQNPIFHFPSSCKSTIRSKVADYRC